MRIHFDQTVRIKRMKTSSGNKMALVATATADASIQPLGKEGGELQEGSFGSTYIAYVDDCIPAKKGDQVVDQNGLYYNITDVVVRDMGAFPFKEIIMVKSDV